MGALGRLGRRVGFRRHAPVRHAIRLTKDAVAAALFYSGTLRLWRRRDRTEPIILMYHSVGGEGIGPGLVVSPENFEAHLRYVRRRYRLTSVEDIVQLVEDGRPVPTDAVAVTLDDGYRDNYEHAFAILKRYDCPATIFVVVDPVEERGVPWPLAIWRGVKDTRRPEIRVSWRGEHGATIDATLRLGTESERASARRTLKRFAGGLGSEERERFVEELARQLGTGTSAGSDESVMLTWEQLREMMRAGITVGAHTLSHPRLADLDADEVRHEVTESRRILREELGAEIDLFAYPFGAPGTFGSATKRAVEEAGYRAAFATRVDGTDMTDRYELERLRIPDEPVRRFGCRLAGHRSGSRLLAWVVRGV
jgi:peptidoglycan/xylan/chitin deacetylase (PgdA/CDA1 family)